MNRFDRSSTTIIQVLSLLTQMCSTSLEICSTSLELCRNTSRVRVEIGERPPSWQFACFFPEVSPNQDPCGWPGAHRAAFLCLFARSSWSLVCPTCCEPPNVVFREMLCTCTHEHTHECARAFMQLHTYTLKCLCTCTRACLRTCFTHAYILQYARLSQIIREDLRRLDYAI